MRTQWTARRVLVTGGAGFVGRRLVDALRTMPQVQVFAPTRAEADLTQPGVAERLINEAAPDLVIHLAALCGGIGLNRARPADLYTANTLMGVQLLEAARVARVKKTLLLGTVCAYPKFTPVPFREDDLWNGYPEETNAPYGLAKKMLLVQAQACRAQYGMNAIYLLPANLYGPGDNFDPQTSHVIPALIQKMVAAQRAGAASVRCWGTGSASREFLYVDDLVEAILLASERYDEPEPLNIGTGVDITIRDLAHEIRQLVGFDGALEWDPSQPDGQPRRRLDVSRAEAALGFRARTPLRQGLRQTIDCYLQNNPPGKTND